MPCRRPKSAWDSAAEPRASPTCPAALQAVEGLADAVTQNRTALVALTAMRNYDNYTFTHMVNVSILTMGQARALGIEGRLLREFGLSALMHDIGKVRTPKEILNKPDKLTDDEFAIMRRHTVDGAEILRRTPEMPILAPVVAFEHHLRIDGTGYPFGVQARRRSTSARCCAASRTCTTRCARSAPTSRRSRPIGFSRCLKRNDGTQFDQHLVRRFVQLLGIYPPGNLVKLNTGEIAVVLQVHAPDPYRPRVRVLFDEAGRAQTSPTNAICSKAWRTAFRRPPSSSPLDPAVGVDPLNFMVQGDQVGDTQAETRSVNAQEVRRLRDFVFENKTPDLLISCSKSS